MTTALDLVLAPVSLAARAERLGRLGRLEPEELRKRAMVACRAADGAALWALTEAHLVTRGRKGASVSPRTLETYQGSVAPLLAWAGPAGGQRLRPRPEGRKDAGAAELAPLLEP